MSRSLSYVRIYVQNIYGLYGLEHHTVEISGDVTMRTDGRTTSEYSATQSMDNVRLSFAIVSVLMHYSYEQPGTNMLGS